MGDRLEGDTPIYPGQEFVSASGEYQLIFQEDSNLVLYKRNDDGSEAIWASNTYSDEGSTNHSVLVQLDGNFVLYNADGQALWASGSNYDAVKPYILVQDDGNVCLYDDEVEGCHWSTGTSQ